MSLSELIQLSLGNLVRQAFTLFAGASRSREFVALDVLADQDGLSQQDLSERLGLNRTLMVRLIDTLEEAGHVTRTRNPLNRRSYVLRLTDSGHQALGEMRKAAAAHDAQVTAVLTPDERRRLNELLGTLLPEPSPLQSTEHLVSQAHYRLRRLGDALLAGTGLRTRHFGPLAGLDALAPCPQQQLARYLRITEPAAAEVVEELVQAGLVVRGRDPHDRRRYALELTDLGRERLKELSEVQVTLQAQVRELLGGPEAERELRELLRKLVG
ncbi:MarR family winged helix-turn-helix transcriptional regulator [Nonomuraea africana]|uniref:DNA-binding MarR family transcriptional regulator n=1 Tax=Nonomuraea africana TaxID=46171 RepID=A0ABR9KUC4_9ACTN|nr:MarR family transcriptional regulator [Nonomuraea africana]MBE1565644.1 DNA-binding MarR family transcriptional regulator [Nonomuraea africana]